METWVARPAATRSRLANIDLRHRLFAALVAVAFLLAAQPLVASADASTGSISGTAFQDMNRDGVQQGNEEPFVDHLLYVFDENGAWVASRRTDDRGYYSVSGLETGTYTVRYAPRDWRNLREEWVPTTTGSLQPEHRVTVAGDANTADFGWRPFERSTDVTDPLTEVTGPEGLRVQSYVDVITAQDIYDHIKTEFLVGDEAADVIVRFGYGYSGSARTTLWHEDGAISRVRTIVYAPYGSWLERGDRTLAHEYGHAWTNYHNYYVRQDVDREWAAYLGARGSDPGDDRVGSSYAWSPHEIAAEDYRQLFASENARSGSQLNKEIPRPWDVEGFEEWLREDFTTPPGYGSDGADEDGSVDDEPADEDGDDGESGEEEADEESGSETMSGSEDGSEESISGVDDEAITLTVETYKVRGVNHADLTWSGNDASHLDVYRNGERITTTNGSTFTDDTGSRGSPTYTYRVCEAGTDACSNVVETRF